MKVFLRVLAVVLAINSQDIHGTDTSLVHGDDEKHNPVAMDNTSPLLPKNGYDIDKAEHIGYLSEESINSVDPLPEDVEAQVQAPQYNKQTSQGSRNLDALQDFIDRCALTSGGKGYVECNGGYAVVDGVTTDQLCADACDGHCCTGEDYYPYNYKIFANGACGFFVEDWAYPEGKMFDGFTGRVCKDGSCDGYSACSSAEDYYDTKIDYVVGPSCSGRESCALAQIGSAYRSCTDEYSCRFAQIGSVDSSCTENNSCNGAQIGSAYRSCRGMYSSCYGAQLSGVDLINSCNAYQSCRGAVTGNPFVNELINCCNDDNQCCNDEPDDHWHHGPGQCSGIVNGKERPYPAEWGCLAPTGTPTISSVPSSSSAPTELALTVFQEHCNDTSGNKGYVDCVGGFVRGTRTTCAEACGNRDYGNGRWFGGVCCTETGSCGFIQPDDGTILGGFTGKVCKDESCSGDNACREAKIDYVVGASCTGLLSCNGAIIGSVDSSCKDDISCDGAIIGSVDSSCKDDRSCEDAQLSGVDLVNSCNKSKACYKTKGKEEISDLIDCCNESIKQCYQEQGADIYAAGGCSAPTISPTISLVPSSSSSPTASAFQVRCESTSKLSGSNAYVDCVDGKVRGTTTGQTCADACGGLCCTGSNACYSFTGKVCKDSSCGKEACVLARIPYVVDSSCTDEYSCRFAQIGSVDSSCKDRYSCINAQLSGVTLINSCNKDFSCQNTIGDEAFEELIGCCNESRQQCEFQDGLDIVDVGCNAKQTPPLPPNNYAVTIEATRSSGRRRRALKLDSDEGSCPDLARIVMEREVDAISSHDRFLGFLKETDMSKKCAKRYLTTAIGTRSNLFDEECNVTIKFNLRMDTLFFDIIEDIIVEALPEEVVLDNVNAVKINCKKNRGGKSGKRGKGDKLGKPGKK